MTNVEKICKFSAAVRGYHFFKRVWTPKESERLNCQFEENNPFDQFAIKTVTGSGLTVGHLPKEISRVTKYLIDRGANVTVQLTSTHYRRSPLVQGGLEIRCEVTVRMPATVKNHLLIEKYVELVKELYTDPKEEVIYGSFLSRATEVDFTAEATTIAKGGMKKTSAKSKVENATTSKDIRQMFLKSVKPKSDQPEQPSNVVELD